MGKNKTAEKPVQPATSNESLENATVTSETASSQPTTPVLEVDFKKAYEAVSAKKFREVPADAIMKTVTGAEINISTTFIAVAQQLVAEAPAEITAIPRQRWLNKMCELTKLQPANSKRTNKSENKATATYGAVVAGADTFESDGENYRILGWLKWPVFRSHGVVFVKYLTYILAMNDATFDQFKKGMLLEDKNINVMQ